MFEHSASGALHEGITDNKDLSPQANPHYAKWPGLTKMGPGPSQIVYQ